MRLIQQRTIQAFKFRTQRDSDCQWRTFKLRRNGETMIRETLTGGLIMNFATIMKTTQSLCETFREVDLLLVACCARQGPLQTGPDPSGWPQALQTGRLPRRPGAPAGLCLQLPSDLPLAGSQSFHLQSSPLVLVLSK